ncbi:cytochrome c oxidase subunit 1 [Irineochytrium annulatum]|nr:cytochrome c oxidase subunit 1 [Irineochytrium annulatum]
MARAVLRAEAEGAAWSNVVKNLGNQKLGEVFSYHTVAIARINDWKLGVIHYLTIVLTIAYILFNIIVNEAYLKEAPPIAGSVRTTLEDSRANPPIPNVFNCDDNQLPNNRNGCLFWSAEQATYPYQGELDSIFITTRVKNVTTLPPPPGCNYQAPTSEVCKPPDVHDPSLKNRTLTHYIADIDSATLLIDHSVRAQYSTGLFTKALNLNTELDMTGHLVENCDLKKFNITFDADYRKTSNATYGTPLDIVPLSQLIANAQCGSQRAYLDDLSTSATANPGEPWRSTGMVISVPVIYDNSKTFGNVAKLKYYYVPTVVNDDSYKVTEKVYNPDGSISYLDRHGIRIIFEQAGTIGQFDLQSLLLSIVGGFTLLSLTTLVVDFVMIFLLKDRKLYRRLKFKDFNVAPSSSSTVGASLPTNTVLRGGVDKRAIATNGGRAGESNAITSLNTITSLDFERQGSDGTYIQMRSGGGGALQHPSLGPSITLNQYAQEQQQPTMSSASASSSGRYPPTEQASTMGSGAGTGGVAAYGGAGRGGQQPQMQAPPRQGANGYGYGSSAGSAAPLTGGYGSYQ